MDFDLQYVAFHEPFAEARKPSNVNREFHEKSWNGWWGKGKEEEEEKKELTFDIHLDSVFYRARSQRNGDLIRESVAKWLVKAKSDAQFFFPPLIPSTWLSLSIEDGLLHACIDDDTSSSCLNT